MKLYGKNISNVYLFALLIIVLISIQWLRDLYIITYDPYRMYYRLVVDLVDKQGRAIGTNIVVGCNLRHGRILGGGTSSEVMGMDASHYAWAIPDGHALSVRTSPAIGAGDTCSGHTTDNGRIPRDWLPFIIWYDEAADLSHGLAYATQDAYASPRSRLVFQGAHITRATAGEFLAFKHHGPANLIPGYLSDALLNSARPQRLGNAVAVSPEMVADPKRAWRNSDWLTCLGVIRVPLRPAVQTELARIRPAGSKKYWQIASGIPDAIIPQIPWISETSGAFMRPDTMEWRKVRPEVYPQTDDRNIDKLNSATFADGFYRRQIFITQDNLGFMDCGRPALAPLEAKITGRDVSPSDSVKETCFINGIMIGESGKCSIYNPIAFENTEFALIRAHELQE